MKNILSRFIIALCILVVIFSCQSDPKPSADIVDNDGKQIRYIEQWVRVPPDFDTLLLSYVEEYDRNNNLIGKKEYSPEGDFLIHTTITYNEHQDEIEKTIFHRREKKKITSTFEITYEEGRKSKITMKSNITDDMKSIFTYYENGDYKRSLIQEGKEVDYELSNKDGLTLETSRLNGKMVQKFKYDEQGNVTFRSRQALNQPEEIVEYKNEYDEHGKLIRKSYENRIEEYFYNEEDQLIKEIWYFVDEVVQIREYTYKYY